MLTRRGSDPEARYFTGCDGNTLPFVEPCYVILRQPLHSSRGRDDLLYCFDKFAAGIIKIVFMLVMAEEHEVYRTNIFGLQPGRARFIQGAWTFVYSAFCIESRIGNDNK